jgi:hypothetical protein
MVVFLTDERSALGNWGFGYARCRRADADDMTGASELERARGIRLEQARRGQLCTVEVGREFAIFRVFEVELRWMPATDGGAPNNERERQKRPNAFQWAKDKNDQTSPIILESR